MKKIGIFCQAPAGSGISVRVNAIKRYLNKLGFQTTYFDLEWIDAKSHFITLNNATALFRKIVLRNNVSMWQEMRTNSRIAEFGKYLKTVLDRFANVITEIDIMQGDGLLGGLTCAQLKKRFGIPFVQVTHGLYALDAAGSSGTRRWINVVTKWEQDILRAADYVAVESIIMKNYLNKTYNISEEKMFVVPNGADLIEERAEYKFPMNVIYGGCFGYWERVVDFVKTAEKLSGEDYNFVLMGDGSRRDEIFDYINTHHVDIAYIGKKTRKEALRRFCSAQIGVIPGLKSVRSEAASSVKLMEYASCGLPVVIVDIGDWGELVRKYDCGIVTENSDPKEFAEAIQQLKDKKIWKRKSENGRRMIQKAYSWDKVLQPLSAIYLDRLS